MEHFKNITSPVSSTPGISPKMLMIKPAGDVPLNIPMNTNEIWMDIFGYEGYYQVSNLGNVRRLSTCLLMKNGIKRTTHGRILKKVFYPNGYEKTTLCINSISKQFLTHRLVAIAFIPNLKNLSEINHLDESKSNNNASNLEWCTHEYNSNYGTRNERMKSSQTGMFTGEKNPMFGKTGNLHPAYGLHGKNHPSSVPVIRIDKNGNQIEYENVTMAAQALNVSKTAISNVLRGKSKSCKGYFFNYN